MQMLRTLLICFAATLTLTGKAQTHTSNIELQKNLVLIAQVENFHPRQHSIDTCVVDGVVIYCLIDGKPWFGEQDELPRYQLTGLTLKMDNKNIALDVTGMFNPNIHHAELKRTQFTWRKVGPGWELTGLFSDGVATYMARWEIIKGAALRTKLTNEERDVDED